MAARKSSRKIPAHGSDRRMSLMSAAVGRLQPTWCFWHSTELHGTGRAVPALRDLVTDSSAKGGFMDAVHLHLMLNHVPVIGLGFVFLTLLVAWMRRDDVLFRLALGFGIVVALGALGARLTGSGAEEAVEKLPGVTETVIERHEDAANLATIVVGVLGIASLGGLWLWRRTPVPRWFQLGLLALAVIGGGLMAYTANLGGQVRHTEIRAGAAQSAESNTGAAKDADGD
jgi:uncharacterized membrane protein